MQLVDSHCHLDDHRHAEGPEPLLARARAAGVVHFVAVGVGETTAAAEEAIALAKARPDVSAVVGLHPHEARLHDEALEAALEALARDPAVVAVGEIGLDYHYEHSSRAAQQEAFRRYIALARRVRKPIVVHTREARDDTLAILEAEGAREVGGIIHCFSEDKTFAARAFDLDFDVSFSGIVTFKGAREVQETAAWAPPDRILVETDSPFLAPVPLRGKRCEPAFVVHTATCVAGLRGVPLEAIAEATTANACRRLRLPLAP